MRLSAIHTFSLQCLGNCYLSAVVIFIVGSWSRWDGQGAVLALPFVIAIWIGCPLSILSTLIGLKRRWQISLLIILLNLPFVVGGVWVMPQHRSKELAWIVEDSGVGVVGGLRSTF